MRPSLIIISVMAAALTPVLAQAGALTVETPVIRASIGRSPNTAAYGTLVNSGSKPDTLVSVRCGCAGMVMVHKSHVTKGVASMDDVSGLVVPAHGSVVLHPDGLHLMIMGLKHPLTQGHAETLVLTFAHARALSVRFVVRTRIDAAPAAMDSMPGMADMPGMTH